ncbi:MAG: hypothetical protein D8M58_21570 [Calditrichaeota bacterium]|nr:MAG: hypothetical protein DWQ03_17035 [Calditrichota bacterium]MBL1208004.1 hypothetical protein [Calditrichota bacterium]NOG47840.1 hypothetical protein [Calditrichota bacterium]
MKNKILDRYEQLKTNLEEFSKTQISLLGLDTNKKLDIFTRQLIDSIRRVDFVGVIKDREVSEFYSDPNNESFDPLKAALFFKQEGLIDEAFWMIFYFVYFGRNRETGWRLAREIYSSYNEDENWTWNRIIENPSEFRNWLNNNYSQMINDGIPRKFGNHRRYSTFNPTKKNNVADAIESYVSWINPPRTHIELFEENFSSSDSNPITTFNSLYVSMNSVLTFGRLAKFDYLTMVAKTGLFSIEPGLAYINGSTGPESGTKLLFYNNINSNVSSSELEEFLVNLRDALELGPLGMQVLEDAICNWQKSTSSYIYFR